MIFDKYLTKINKIFTFKSTIRSQAMEKSTRKLIRPADIVIIILIVALSVGILVGAFSPDESSLVAVVTVDGKEVRRIDLTSCEDEIITLDTSPTVTLQVKDGKIRFIDSLCPDSVCEDSGYLQSHGDTAACVPAGTVVTIQGSSHSDIDAIAG